MTDTQTPGGGCPRPALQPNRAGFQLLEVLGQVLVHFEHGHLVLAVEHRLQLGVGEVVSKIWAYIKSNNLQNPANKREILADAKLKPVFDGKDKVSMFEMNKHLAQHLK